MNGVRAGLDEWMRENAKDEEGEGFSARLTRGKRSEWMALFMRTDFCSDSRNPHWAGKKGRVLGTRAMRSMSEPS